MFHSDRTNRKLSQDLRLMVHQSLGKSKQRTTGTANDRGRNKEKICECIENIREGIQEPAMQDELSRSTHSAVLDEVQGTSLATRVLPKLQDKPNAVF